MTSLSPGLRADLRENVLARELPDQVGMRLGDVALHLCDELIVVLTTHDKSVPLAFEHLGHRCSFRSWASDGRNRSFREPFADLSNLGRDGTGQRSENPAVRPARGPAGRAADRGHAAR